MYILRELELIRCQEIVYLKILILEIKEKKFSFSWSFKRFLLFLVYKTNILFKLLKQLMSIYFLIFLFIYFASILVFTFKRKHLLLILLSLESSVVSLYIGLFFLLSGIDYEFFYSIIYLTIRVCEGALGLSLLVLMIRVHGNDYILTFDSLW